MIECLDTPPDAPPSPLPMPSVGDVELGGVLFAAIVVVIACLVPHLVQRRSAITQSRERDRFSPGLRLLSAGRASATGCQHTGLRILPDRTTVTHRARGEDMDTIARRPAATGHVSREQGRAVRELAQVRARRAARLASERAAVQRRLLMVGALAAVTLVVALVGALTPLAVAWTLVPLAGTLGGLAVTRLAAIRAQRIGEEEIAELARLRAVIEGNASGVAETVSAPEADVTGTLELEAVDTSEQEGVTEEIAQLVAEASTSGASSEEAGEAEEIVAAEDVDAVVARDVKAAALQWAPRPLPTPLYARKGRVAGRAVHADTDLRGIPRVEAPVPARPVAVSTEDVELRSTEEVVASQPVVLDLDAVLDARRAQ